MEANVEVEDDIGIAASRRGQFPQPFIQILEPLDQRAASLRLKTGTGAGGQALDVSDNTIEFPSILVRHRSHGKFCLAATPGADQNVSFLLQSMKRRQHERTTHPDP